MNKKIWLLAALTIFLAACGSVGESGGDTAVSPQILTLPELSPPDLQGRKLRVAATTSVIGDVAAQVGGDAIDLTTLIPPGQDPHGYEPSADDLRLVSEADVIFVNGWDLEETLAKSLRGMAEDTAVVPISANIQPRILDEKTGAVDPHVWLDPYLVEQWVDNAALVLGELDEGNTAVYQTNAQNYLAELKALEESMTADLSAIPPEKRVLVTNHDALGYFAARFDFEILGTVIPSTSALAEPSAADMADLAAKMRQAGVCTIFTETTGNERLAQAVAGELDFCDEVQALSLYTGALGPPGSGADSYLGMMRANTATIVKGLR